MKTLSVMFGTLLCLCAGAPGQVGQAPPAPQDQVPIYRVTVVGRTIKAVNYGHRNTPTKIGFKGTVLEPFAEGKATVESKRGATQIKAEFEKLPPPTKFGRQYLTYVLWAITPEGRPTNMGELILDDDNEGKLNVTSELQSFGMLVTAEPYYSVVQPSDVVVMENVVRSDTVGKVEHVEAKYELLPRGEYTLSAAPGEPVTEEKKLSLSRYEAVLELYQARNAVQIARAQGADRYAPESLVKGERLLREAESQHARKMSPKQIVMTARQSAQAAEDARIITMRRLEEERQANEQKLAAEREARAREEARAVSEQARQEELNRTSQETREDAIRITPPPERQPLPPPPVDARARLVQDLNMILDTRPTHRGVAVSLSEELFEPASAILRPAARDKLARLSGILSVHPGMKVEVEGYSHPVGTQPQLFSQRAAAVRDYLVGLGVPAVSITARGFSMRPPAGSPQHARVELLLSGEPAGGSAPTSAALR